MFRKYLISLIEKVVVEMRLASRSEVLYSLDKEKMYILILPNDIGKVELTEAFETVRGRANLLVIQADSAKLLELK